MADHFLQQYQRSFWVYKYNLVPNSKNIPKNTGSGQYYTIGGFHMFETKSSISSRASFDAKTGGSPFTMVTDVLAYDGGNYDK